MADYKSATVERPPRNQSLQGWFPTVSNLIPSEIVASRASTVCTRLRASQETHGSNMSCTLKSQLFPSWSSVGGGSLPCFLQTPSKRLHRVRWTATANTISNHGYSSILLYGIKYGIFSHEIRMGFTKGQNQRNETRGFLHSVPRGLLRSQPCHRQGHQAQHPPERTVLLLP